MGIDISAITTNADQRLRTLFEDRIYANVISIVDQTINRALRRRYSVTLQLALNAGTVAIPAGLQPVHEIDFNCRIKSWTLVADADSDVEIDVLWGTYDEYPTMMSACGANTLTLTAQDKNRSTTNLALDWPLVNFPAGSWLQVNILSCTAKRLSIIFRLERSA